jgi:hypothetical protein
MPGPRRVAFGGFAQAEVRRARPEMPSTATTRNGTNLGIFMGSVLELLLYRQA